MFLLFFCLISSQLLLILVSWSFVKFFWLNIGLSSRALRGLHFCGLPRENFLLGQSDNFLCLLRKFRRSHWQCKGTKISDAKQAFFSFISNLFELLKRQHGVTQLHSYAVSFTVGEVSFSNGYLYYIIYIIYYIYNIKIIFPPKVTAQLHLMQLRNCVTV